MDWASLIKPVRALAEWVAAARDLGAMRRDIADLKRAGGDPLRCTACGQRLMVVALRDTHNTHGELMGEELDLRCETPGCAFTPRTRRVPFRRR